MSNHGNLSETAGIPCVQLDLTQSIHEQLDEAIIQSAATHRAILRIDISEAATCRFASELRSMTTAERKETGSMHGAKDPEGQFRWRTIPIRCKILPDDMCFVILEAFDLQTFRGEDPKQKIIPSKN